MSASFQNKSILFQQNSRPFHWAAVFSLWCTEIKKEKRSKSTGTEAGLPGACLPL